MITREEQFNGFINDIHEPVTIMGITFDAAEILKRLDPIAYRQEYSMFLQWQDLEHERQCK